MKRDLDALAREEFDVLVVGGGIFGAATAWEAVTRGLKVALIESHDFIHATSANCFKVIHGGVRYMQHADIPRVRASVAERSSFLKIAPHQARPLPIVVPTYGHGKQGKAFLSTGMYAYDCLTMDRNRGISDVDRKIPGHRVLDRETTVRDFPWLDEDDLTGAVLFYDGQMYSPERLGLAFVLSSAKDGACVANYCEATQFIKDGDRVTGVLARDAITGNSFEIKAKAVVNAAGPWAERLLGKSTQLALQQPSTFSRDAWFLVRRPWVSSLALAVQARTHDPDALLSRSARHLFVVPWRGHTIIGVWHVVTDMSPDDVNVPDEDLETFLDELNAGCPGLDIKMEEVGAWNAGLVLFGENSDGNENLSYGKRSRLIDHQQDHGIDGLVTLIGVRYTTARGEAERAMNLVELKLGRRKSKSVTRDRVLVGGEIGAVADHQGRVASFLGLPLDSRMVESVGANYGDQWRAMLDAGGGSLAAIAGTHVLEAEIRHSCRAEMATRLEDVVMRRTELADGRHPGDAALSQVADIMASELGWDAGRRDEEITVADAALAHRRYRKI